MNKAKEVKVELLEIVNKIGDEFESFPWEDPNAYIHWLAQTYFFVRHTTCFLALSASRWGVNRRKEQYKALAHLREESAHDTLLVKDLQAMGAFLDPHDEWPETQAFYQTQYYWIEHETPAAHLGYAYMLEGMACKRAPSAYKRIVAEHGELAGTFLKVHAEEDPHHFEHGLKFLEQLNDVELKAFQYCLRQSYLMYSQILTKARSKAHNFKNYETIIPANISAPQFLGRTPEPESITDQKESVAEYNQVMNTNMTVNYSTGLDLIYRTRENNSDKKALDICSGPGHFSFCLKKFLNYEEVVGIDLSKPMVEIANTNSEQLGYKNKIKFEAANATNLSQFKDETFDLVAFTNSAHHFKSLEDVTQVMKEADRVAKSDGIVILTDLGRLKNSDITEAFVRVAGREFIQKNMPHMYKDFYNSMFAAWLPSELAKALSFDTKREWVHIVPTGLSFYQAIIGLPVGRSELYLRKSFDWANSGILKSEEAKSDLWILQKGIGEAHITKITKPYKKVA